MWESVLAQASPFPQDDTLREQVLARCVLDYLAAHPRAMDTLEGIAEWWVMREQVRVDLQLLGRVLRQLTEQGLLEEIHSGAEVRFSLKRRAENSPGG
jgi:Fe2+ or Zn2+ uptake regulation protein